MIVAVTGNTGSGKSVVADLFACWGARKIDADRMGREVWETDPEVRARIARVLGPSVLGPGGFPDRGLLAKAVFGDPAKLEAFDAIVQPILKEKVRSAIREARAEEGAVWVLDAALLFEWGIGRDVDRIVAVVSPSDTRAARIAERHGIPAEEAAARVRSQTDEREKARRAHFVIENTGTLDDLEARARAVWDAIRSGGPSA